MDNGFVLDFIQVRDDGGITFAVRKTSGEVSTKLGVILADALQRLNGGPYTDAVLVFNAYQERITRRAGAHWDANPLNEYVILGRGEF